MTLLENNYCIPGYELKDVSLNVLDKYTVKKMLN